MTDKHPITVYLSKEEKAELRVEAARHSQSISEYVRALLLKRMENDNG